MHSQSSHSSSGLHYSAHSLHFEHLVQSIHLFTAHSSHSLLEGVF